MSDQLLNGWPVPKTVGGFDDGRGVGVWTADLFAYLVEGRSCYETEAGDPSGPAIGRYLDRLLKDEIRNPLRAAVAALVRIEAASVPVIDYKQLAAALLDEISARRMA